MRVCVWVGNFSSPSQIKEFTFQSEASGKGISCRIQSETLCELTSFLRSLRPNHSRAFWSHDPRFHPSHSQSPACTPFSSYSFSAWPRQQQVISQLATTSSSRASSLSRQAKVIVTVILYPHQVVCCSIYHLYQAVCVFKQDLQHHLNSNSEHVVTVVLLVSTKLTLIQLGGKSIFPIQLVAIYSIHVCVCLYIHINW